MCRVRGEQRETVNHLLDGCKIIAVRKYIRRHNRALMVFAVEWVKEHQLIVEKTCHREQQRTTEQS